MTAIHDLEQWEHEVQHICGDFHAAPPRDTSIFTGSIDLSQWGGLEVAQIQTNASSIARTQTGRNDDRFCFLVLQRKGNMVIHHDNASFALHPGEMALLDATCALEMQPQGLIEQLSLHIPRQLLERDQPQSTPASFGKLSPHHTYTQIVKDMVRQFLWRQHLPASAEEGQAIQAALAILLRCRAQPSDLQQLLDTKTRIKRHIAQHLDQPSLTPLLVSKAFGISSRQLYRLFSDEKGIARYITNQRILHSIDDLMDCSSSRLTITEISYKWGFYDSAQFCRTFKKYQGKSPVAFRKNQ